MQQAIGRLAPKLARAKGLFETVEQPGRLMVFQLAGGRATLAPGGAPAPGVPRTRIVFIAELGVLSAPRSTAIMQACVGSGRVIVNLPETGPRSRDTLIGKNISSGDRQ